jgi:hypothetical protein
LSKVRRERNYGIRNLRSGDFEIRDGSPGPDGTEQVQEHGLPLFHTILMS